MWHDDFPQFPVLWDRIQFRAETEIKKRNPIVKMGNTRHRQTLKKMDKDSLWIDEGGSRRRFKIFPRPLPLLINKNSAPVPQSQSQNEIEDQQDGNGAGGSQISWQWNQSEDLPNFSFYADDPLNQISSEETYYYYEEEDEDIPFPVPVPVEIVHETSRGIISDTEEEIFTPLFVKTEYVSPLHDLSEELQSQIEHQRHILDKMSLSSSSPHKEGQGQGQRQNVVGSLSLEGPETETELPAPVTVTEHSNQEHQPSGFTFTDSNDEPLTPETLAYFSRLRVVYATAVVAANSTPKLLESGGGGSIKSLLLFSEVGALTPPNELGKTRLVTVRSRPNQLLSAGQHQHLKLSLPPTVTEQIFDVKSTETCQFLSPQPLTMMVPIQDSTPITSLIPIHVHQDTGRQFTAKATFAPFPFPLNSESGPEFSCQLVTNLEDTVVCQQLLSASSKTNKFIPNNSPSHIIEQSTETKDTEEAEAEAQQKVDLDDVNNCYNGNTSATIAEEVLLQNKTTPQTHQTFGAPIDLAMMNEITTTTTNGLNEETVDLSPTEYDVPPWNQLVPYHHEVVLPSPKPIPKLLKVQQASRKVTKVKDLLIKLKESKQEEQQPINLKQNWPTHVAPPKRNSGSTRKQHLKSKLAPELYDMDPSPATFELGLDLMKADGDSGSGSNRKVTKSHTPSIHEETKISRKKEAKPTERDQRKSNPAGDTSAHADFAIFEFADEGEQAAEVEIEKKGATPKVSARNKIVTKKKQQKEPRKSKSNSKTSVITKSSPNPNAGKRIKTPPPLIIKSKASRGRKNSKKDEESTPKTKTRTNELSAVSSDSANRGRGRGRGKTKKGQLQQQQDVDSNSRCDKVAKQQVKAKDKTATKLFKDPVPSVAVENENLPISKNKNNKKKGKIPTDVVASKVSVRNEGNTTEVINDPSVSSTTVTDFNPTQTLSAEEGQKPSPATPIPTPLPTSTVTSSDSEMVGNSSKMNDLNHTVCSSPDPVTFTSSHKGDLIASVPESGMIDVPGAVEAKPSEVVTNSISAPIQTTNLSLIRPESSTDIMEVSSPSNSETFLKPKDNQIEGDVEVQVQVGGASKVADEDREKGTENNLLAPRKCQMCHRNNPANAGLLVLADVATMSYREQFGPQSSCVAAPGDEPATPLNSPSNVNSSDSGQQQQQQSQADIAKAIENVSSQRKRSGSQYRSAERERPIPPCPHLSFKKRMKLSYHDPYRRTCQHDN